MIYLDNSSTTQVKAEVAEKTVNAMTKDFGNPSSLHRLGLNAEKIVKESRAIIAKAVNADPSEIYFTSCGTESDNTVIKSVVESGKYRGKKIITTEVEHPAVLKPCEWAEAKGYTVIRIPVDKNCMIDLGALEDALDADTLLVSVMAVNNEVGSVMPLEKVRELITKKAPQALFHTDAVQAFEKTELDVKKLGLDFLSISGHKIHAPKGIGALYVKKGVHVPPFMLGGGQESQFRSGTESVPLIAGFGEAVRLAEADKAARIKHIRETRDYLKEGIIKTFGERAQINSPEDGVCSILNVSFTGCRGEVLLHMLEENGIYVSTGSACSSNSKKKGSHVLRAMGLSDDAIEGAIRFSLSEFNTKDEMDQVLKTLKEVVDVHSALLKLQHPGKFRA